MKDNKYIKRIKEEFEANPILVLAVGAAAVTAAAKLIDSVSAAQGRRAYAKQVEYRVNYRK